MFTGIIQQTGKVTKISKGKSSSTFTIKPSSTLKNKKVGDSIAVNGACVTITNIKNNEFTFDAIKETLDLTNLSNLKKDDEVNLEPPLTLTQGIDGHLVQGHIDTKAPTVSLKKGTLTISQPQPINKYLALKGSITINGVSLTITDIQTNNFSVELIPHTLKATNLGKLKKGDEVNLEVDLIARYLKRLLDNKEKETTYEFLKERNFI